MTGNLNPYYPPRQKTGPLDDEWRQLYSHMYASRKQIEDLQTQMSFLQKSHGKLQRQVAAGGPSSTKIAGLNVIGTPPQSGNKVSSLSGVPVLGYNSSTGQFEYFITP